MPTIRKLLSYVTPDRVIWIMLTVLFFIAGLGNVTVSLTFFGVLVSYCLLYFIYIKNSKIIFPKGINSYFLFLLFFLISIFWSKASVTTLIYFLMFLTGGFFWIFFYNYKERPFAGMVNFDRMMIILGLSFGIYSIYNFITKSAVINASGLINYTVPSLDHHHIGDFWGAIIVPLFYRFTKKEKPSFWLYLLIILGLYFIAVSFSRSAYVALIAGLLYILTQVKLTLNNKKMLSIIVFFAVAFCVWSSMGKGLISHRLFYISGVMAALKQPFGSGIGSFGILLQENTSQLVAYGYSSVADNILLDVAVGLGVLSLPFFYWLLITTKMLIWDKNAKNIEYKIFFLTLMVNFMFNHIYVIPVIVWLWFASLALWQE